MGKKSRKDELFYENLDFNFLLIIQIDYIIYFNITPRLIFH